LLLHAAVFLLVIKRSMFKNYVLCLGHFHHTHLLRHLSVVIHRKAHPIAFCARNAPVTEPARRVIDICHNLTAATVCLTAALIIQFSLLVQRNLEDELKIINQMWRKDYDQYQIASETIEQINYKCHDMRHQIRTIGQSANVTPEALKEMEKAISIYDSMFQTGCRVLDIILTEKSLYCQKNNIVIKCIADGSALCFIRDADIYSLFGNLLDNAIHAVQELEEEQRIISLTVKLCGELLSINSYNCYTGEMMMRDGLPVTSGDPKYHGFGAKSMVAIVNKYGGTVSFQAKDGIFNLNMLFSLSDIQRRDKVSSKR